MRSLKSSIEMSMWEVPVRLTEPELQQSTIHVTLTTTKSGIHTQAPSRFNQCSVKYLPWWGEGRKQKNTCKHYLATTGNRTRRMAVMSTCDAVRTPTQYTSPTRDRWPAIVLSLTNPKIHLSTLSWGVHVVGGWSSEI